MPPKIPDSKKARLSRFFAKLRKDRLFVTFFYPFSAAAHLLFLLALPVMPSLQAHSSWSMFHGHAFDEGLRHGREICSTLGPWGIFYNRWFDPNHYAALFLISVFVAILVGLIVARILSGAPSLLRAPLALVIAWILGLNQDGLYFGMLLALVTLLFFSEQERADFIFAAIATILLAFFGTVKFTILLGGVATILLVETNWQFRRRVFPFFGLSFVSFSFLFFLSAGQSLRDFPAFIKNSIEFAHGYSEAMQLFGPNWQVVIYLLIASLGFGVLAVNEIRTQRWNAAIPLVCLLLIAFLAFKAGFVRHDSAHAMTGYCYLSLWLCLMTGRWRGKKAWPTWSRCVSVALLTLSLSLMILVVSDAWRLGGAKGVWRVALARCRSVVEVVSGGPGGAFESWNQRFDWALRRIREERPIVGIAGSVDVYPTGYAAVIAHELELSSRPIPASFAAFTPGLLEMNRAHLLGEKAPSILLFEIKPIDRRFPALDDGASWPELLSRYKPVGETGKFLVLGRRLKRRTVYPAVSESLVASFGEKVKVPDGDWLVFARFEFTRSLLGRCLGFMYKFPVITMNIRTSDNEARSYRIVPGMSRSWFLLSPLVESWEDFAAVSEGVTAETTQIVEVEFSGGPGVSHAYQDPIRIVFGAVRNGMSVSHSPG